ncbi:hypothetical protein QOZ80_2AG0131240 [Eleusine coracana subsp. coracana]|nr:hypothetical protein QOZ80_2AG0131240 [Eleusine coracana subsp. coracana]
MAPPRAAGTGAPSRQLLRAAADGDLRLFKSIARALDGGKGCIREAVEAVGDRAPGCCTWRPAANLLHFHIPHLIHLGDAPLAHAVRGYKVDTVRYLLDHGADPNKPGEHGCTALHVAAGAGMCEVIQVLLSKGADVDSFSYCGAPLHAAIIGKQDAALKVLLDNHADAGADVKGVGQLTPLIAAANDGLTDFYKCLLEAGADPNVRDDGGQLPIEIAARNNRRKDVEILFPVTSRIPYVRDWSVDGILAYVKAVPKEEDDPLYKMGPDYLKPEGSKEYKRKDYVSAVNFYSMAIKLDPEDVILYSNKCLC